MEVETAIKMRTKESVFIKRYFNYIGLLSRKYLERGDYSLLR